MIFPKKLNYSEYTLRPKKLLIINTEIFLMTGFINQKEETLFDNKKCQAVISYEDIKDDLCIFKLTEEKEKNSGKFELRYILNMNLFNTG